MKEIKNKKKYEFTDIETEDIISKYKSGISCNKIANDYPCSSKTIERYLRKCGIVASDNPNFNPIDNLSEDDIKYIIENFINGKSAIILAKEYNCNEGSIRKLLAKNNITFKDAKHYNMKHFSKNEIDYIIEQYKNGATVCELTFIYKCNYKTLRKLIPDNIFEQFKFKKKRKLRKYKELTTIEKESIKNDYLSGIFQKELAFKFNTSLETIHNILKEQNINGKDNPNWNKEIKSFNEDKKQEIIELYLNGIKQEDIANKYNCSRDYINTILYEYGYSYKDNPNYNYGISKDLELDINNIIDMYNSGNSINEIKDFYHVSSGVISKLLQDNGISIRQNYDNYSEEELIQFLKDIYNDYGYVDTYLINSIENCPTSATYTTRFKTFGNAMKQADLPYSTTVPIRLLDDEVCKSGFEYRLSCMFKKYNLKYDRDYLYSNLIPNYNRKHSLDYKLYYENKIIYIEIFGISDSSFNDNKYNETKEMKLNLCEIHNIPLLELYPNDFNLNNEEFEKHIFAKLNNYNNGGE